MANYLTTDTELTAVADAIRAKGGTSEPLGYPAGFVSAISSLPGLRYAVIDKTFTGTTGGTKLFTHNLGSVNVAVLFYPIGTVQPANYYHTWYAELLNLPGLVSDAQVLDFTLYNSAKFPEPVTVNLKTAANLKVGNGYGSPHTSQTKWSDGTFYGQLRSYWTFNPNDIRYSNNIAAGSYRMVVVDLSPLVTALSGPT